MDLLKSFFAVLRWVEAATILLLALRAAPTATRTFVNFIGVAFSVINSPCFLFVVGNGIVLLLFFKYRNLDDDDLNNTINNNNENYNSEDVYNGLIGFPIKPVQEEEEKKQEQEVVYEDKEVVSTGIHRGRACRRSKSERKMSPKLPELKRSKTDMVSEDDDSEEFRRTIEAFIEKQLKFQREESKSISMSTAEMPTDMLAIVSAAPPDEGKEKE